MTPRVSVLIGAYNNAATLERAIDSMLAQTSVPVLVVRPSTVEQAPTQVVVAYDDSDQRLDHRRAAEIAAVVGHRLARALRIPLVACKASVESPSDLDSIADHVQVAPDGHLATLLQGATAPGDIIVKALPSTRAGLGSRFVRQTRGLDDRVIVATSPASTDIAAT